jgi:hypothetical protein
MSASNAEINAFSAANTTVATPATAAPQPVTTTIITDPISNPQAYDSFYIGGVQSPGLCDFKGGGIEYKWDTKAGKGASGGTSTFTGKEVNKDIICTLRFWLSSHFVAWDAFRALLKFDPTKKTVSALDIRYPALQRVGINSVQCVKIGAEERVHDSGLWAVKISFLEYNPVAAVAAVATPTSSTSSSATAEQAAAQAGNATTPASAQQLLEQLQLQQKAQTP